MKKIHGSKNILLKNYRNGYIGYINTQVNIGDYIYSDSLDRVVKVVSSADNTSNKVLFATNNLNLDLPIIELENSLNKQLLGLSDIEIVKSLKNTKLFNVDDIKYAINEYNKLYQTIEDEVAMGLDDPSIFDITHEKTINIIINNLLNKIPISVDIITENDELVIINNRVVYNNINY